MVGSLVSIKISCSYCARSEPVVSESCSLKSRDIFILTREPTICSIHVFCHQPKPTNLLRRPTPILQRTHPHILLKNPTEIPLLRIPHRFPDLPHRKLRIMSKKLLRFLHPQRDHIFGRCGVILLYKNFCKITGTVMQS